jgi:hypothetical protein
LRPNLRNVLGNPDISIPVGRKTSSYRSQIS